MPKGNKWISGEEKLPVWHIHHSEMLYIFASQPIKIYEMKASTADWNVFVKIALPTFELWTPSARSSPSSENSISGWFTTKPLTDASAVRPALLILFRFLSTDRMSRAPIQFLRGRISDQIYLQLLAISLLHICRAYFEHTILRL